jgi:hypothetical protein
LEKAAGGDGDGGQHLCAATAYVLYKELLDGA